MLRFCSRLMQEIPESRKTEESANVDANGLDFFYSRRSEDL
jgi:hypothetical protein